MSEPPNLSGGFWNTPNVVYSDATKALLQDIMKEANVANAYKNQIKAQLKKGEALDLNLRSDPPPKRNQTRENLARKNQRSTRPGIRPKHIIDATKDDTPSYRPDPVPKIAKPPEKSRLAHLMAYGEEPTRKQSNDAKLNTGRFAYLRRKLEGNRKVGAWKDEESNSITDDDRFNEIIREVKERRQFLDQMRIMGREDMYKGKVETEISQLVREMEEIDMRRNKALEQAMGDRAQIRRTR